MISFFSLTLEMLDDAPQAVAMSGDKDPFSFLDLGNNFLVPERKCPGNGVLETFAAGKLIPRQVTITPVLPRKDKVPAVSGFRVRLHTCMFYRRKKASLDAFPLTI